MNPYNSSVPGNLFVGYERLRREILAGFRNGNSFAILGGRRCGKTSLLLQIQKDLETADLAPFRALPRFLDLQANVPRSPSLFFQAIFELLANDTADIAWQAGASDAYQNFLSQMDGLAPTLDRKWGSDWLAILLIDELDAAVSKLPDDQCFQNIRNLLMVSRFHRHFRVMATGVREMAKLISSGSSPLNNLRHKYLGILTATQTGQLIGHGFPGGFSADVASLALELTGRHPYVLQGVLEKIDGSQEEIGRTAVRDAAREFLREQGSNFKRWVDGFGEAELAVYSVLASHGKMDVEELRGSLGPRLSQETEEALNVLSYHGVIDDTEADEPRIAGTLFRDWYVKHSPNRPERNAGTRVKEVARDPRKVFVVHGRNDEARKEMFEYLRSIGLEPLEWSQVVKATGKTAPFIGEILETGFSLAQAAIVLMTPDDEARLRERFWKADEAEYETQFTPQARPNVLFEAGMALGLFPERTILVEVGRLRPFSNIAGRHSIQLKDAGAKQELADRLESAGCVRGSEAAG